MQGFVHTWQLWSNTVFSDTDNRLPFYLPEAVKDESGGVV